MAKALAAAAPLNDPMVTPEELSDETGIPVATLYVWRHRQKGPQGFKLGRHLRYRRSEINRWLRECGDTALNGTH